MRSRRTTQIRIALALVGAGALLLTATVAKAQQISLSGEVANQNASFSTMVASTASSTASVQKTLRVEADKPFKLRLAAPSSGLLACQEFPANGTTALRDGGGWKASSTTEIEVRPGNRLYPRQGEEKFLVIRCVAADKRTIVSDSIKIVR